MSVTMMSQVFKHSKAKLGSRLVLLAIADTAKDDGVAWDSVPVLAKKVQMSESSVRRCIDDLEEKGEIQVAQVRMGRSTINVYRMRVGEVDDIDWKRFPSEVKTAVEDWIDALRIGVSPKDSPADPGLSPADPGTSPLKEVVLNRNEPLEKREPNGSLVSEPPKLTLIDKQNLPLNALAEACNADPGGSEKGKLAVALNGRGAEQGIRALFWRELVLRAEAKGRTADLEQVRGVRFERALAKAIRERAEMYPRKLPPGTMLTPTALRSWWSRIESEPDRPTKGSGVKLLTPEEDTFSWGDV